MFSFNMVIYLLIMYYSYLPEGAFVQHKHRNMGQMVYNYKMVVKGLACLIIKGLG